jgi:hypothetical protein
VIRTPTIFVSSTRNFSGLPDLSACRLHPDRHGVCLREPVRLEPDPGHVFPVLLGVLADLIGGWRVFDYHGRALDAHYVAAVGVGVEIEVDAWVVWDVAQLLPTRLGVDEYMILNSHTL